MYQVLARKWRPQTFEDLVGQPHVCRTLTNAITSDRLAHAYIFSGLRGTGKTSAARILAKSLDCEQGPTATPCNACTPCREITEGRAIDVLEIDAASRTKVEQTRELLETLSYAPTRDRYKVLIIDEVHMLSKSSFNALLKTLEEPPPRVVFVLATTELHKILPTILSRCQVFEFRRVTPAELSAHLRRLADAEEIEISDASLDRIARYGEGSIRDSLSILERVLAFCGKQVDDDDVLNALGAVRTEVLVRMVEALAARDAGGMLTVLDEVAGEGRDLLHLWSELIGVLRDLQVLRAAPGQDQLLTRTADEARALSEAAADLSREDLNRAFHVLAGVEYALKSSAQPRFLFESALIRLASLGAVRPIEEFLGGLGALDPGTLRGGGGSGPAGGGSRSGPRGGSSSPGPARRGGSPGPGAQRRAAPHGAGGEAPVSGPVPAGNGRPAMADLLDGIEPTEGGHPQFRARFEQAVRKVKPMLGVLLGHASSIRVDRDEVVVAFAPDDDVSFRQVEREDYRALLTAVGEALCGARSLRLARETASAVPSPPGSPRVGSNGTRPKRPENGAAAPSNDRNALMAAAKSDTAVQNLLREFGAQVVDIRPLAEPTLAEPVPDDGAGMEESP